ncbi:MarR family transcriptional regulator [Cytobacillus depressus]|uniref:MarR family transcriptional regulator n=1 Tax=Cytobacillus depressus TaxID=1602942 RepID=A0A6L3V9R9_9BACI|nr:MarR family transcriptional regulator [Cytobacillus depressus]KAB2336117.1 MarR family transcriptional regulator [Cytobacillus depressus]
MLKENLSREQLLELFNEELRNFSTETIMFHQNVAERLGLNSTDHKCLDIILQNYPMTAGKLAEMTGFTTGTVTGVIDRLEKACYVYRDKDPKDRRRVMINVHFQKVEKEILPLFASFSQSMRELFEKYNDQEIKFLFDFVARSRAILHEESKKVR